MKTMIYY